MTNSSSFRVEDWVYVADPMGRLGQGHYKNKQNPSQTLSVAEFENRRKQALLPISTGKEHKVNNITPQPARPTNIASPASQLTPATQAQETLTPWDNPVMGEQSLKTSPQQNPKETRQPTQKNNSGDQSEQQSQENVGSGPSEGPEGFAGTNDAESSSGGEAKVICSELVRQGFMTQYERRLCQQYARKHLPAAFMSGYHFWAKPYVRLMQRSSTATRLVHPFAMRRIDAVKYHLGKTPKVSFFSYLTCFLHDHFCILLGKIIAQTERCFYRESNLSMSQ